MPHPDSQAVERKNYPGLVREETVHSLRIVAARRATRNDSRAQLDAVAVRTEVIDGRPSEGYARRLDHDMQTYSVLPEEISGCPDANAHPGGSTF